jgi:signal transduction histidine kinase
MFSSNDIAVFQVLANQAALAIENAIFYEETRKTLAQQFHEHRLRSIGKMGSYMGHQINNRFHAILTRAEEALLLALKKIDRNNLSDEQRRLIEKAEGSLNYIKEEAARGGSITQRLTAFSRKETKFKPNDIHEVISATLELLSCKFNTEELNLKIEIENRDYKIYGDMAQLQDIFFNLLDNAHDAEQQKKKENENYVPRTLIRGYIENSSWHIELTDNGTGMTQEHLEQLFLPFFTTKATSEKGTGIGLAVIKSMIESQNGGISAKSKYGEGTTFYIIIPAVKGEE